MDVHIKKLQPNPKACLLMNKECQISIASNKVGVTIHLRHCHLGIAHSNVPVCPRKHVVILMLAYWRTTHGGEASGSSLRISGTPELPLHPSISYGNLLDLG